MNTRNAYTVIVPNQLKAGWLNLSRSDHDQLDQRLRRAARASFASPAVWPAGKPGIHRGRHRALVGDWWLTYQVDDRAQTLELVGFEYTGA